MYDIITVGSGTVDVFVRTTHNEFRDHRGHSDVCYTIGDKVLIRDIDFATGGGGTNTAVSFSRMGLKTAWLGMVGQDANMHYIMEVLKEERVDFIGNSKKGKSGYSVILVGLQKDRTILTYKGINDTLDLSERKLRDLRPKWFYFSAMLGKSLDTQKRIALHAQKHNIPYAFNPSCYLAEQGVRKLGVLVKGATLLVMNAQEVASLLKTNEKDIAENTKKLARYCKIAVVTDGPRPTYASDGRTLHKLTPDTRKIVDTTGAGDAFASALVSALAKQHTLVEALKIGYANARSILTRIGAKNDLLTYTKARAASKRVHVEVIA